jgi:hypothetical protein
MANNFRVDDFNLKDPIQDIQDPLQDPLQQQLQKPPGFFQTLRNPMELLFEESLPASLYQWATGNTKKKQAEDALRFLQRYPELQGTGQYKEAERIYNKFGYLLEEGEQKFDFGEVVKLAKKHPGIMGAELVNMVVADPYLLLLPVTLYSRLGRGIVNATRAAYKGGKYAQPAAKANYLHDIKVGAAASILTPLAFSTGMQLGEKGEVSLNRTTSETTIGATAGLLISTALGATSALLTKKTGLANNVVNDAIRKGFSKDPATALDLNPDSGLINGLHNAKLYLQKIVPEEDFSKFFYETQAATDIINSNAKYMSKSGAFKKFLIGAGSFGAIGATAQFLTEPKDKLEESLVGFGTGAALYTGLRGFGKLISKAPDPMVEKNIATIENALEAMQLYQHRVEVPLTQMYDDFVNLIPDQTRRRHIFHYIQGTKVDRNGFISEAGRVLTKADLTSAELEAVEFLRKAFDIMRNEVNKYGNNAIRGYRMNYLPLLWEEFEKSPITSSERFIAGVSKSTRFGKQRIIDDINEGLNKGYKLKKGMDDPAALLKIYGRSVSRVIANRQFVNFLNNSQFSPLVIPINIRNGNKVVRLPLLISNNKQLAIVQSQFKSSSKNFDDMYVKFNHPFLGDREFTYIARGTEKAIRMTFDATEHTGFIAGVFLTNIMMKRLAVGFSFFHAGALIESMIFAGSKFKTIGRFTKGAFEKNKSQIEDMINKPGVYLQEFENANRAIKQTGFNDTIRFAQGNGLVISVPEDAGLDQFYAQMRKLDNFLKYKFGIKNSDAIEKIFKWFDKITWDKIFTHAKVYTFLTQLNKLIDPAVDKTQAQIYAKARIAAQFTNDAFGGQNWRQLTTRVQTPIFKKLAQTMYAPGSRGYMQLLMFAPDWTISNIRILGKALPAFERNSDARRMYGYYFARSAIMYATLGTALNYIFSGHSQLENKDPTRIDLGNGDVLTFSKQLMEPFHWITDPQKTGLKKIGSLPRGVIELLTNKQYLTTGWAPSITTKDDTAIEKAIKIGGKAGEKFLPIWLQSSVRTTKEMLESNQVPSDIAADVALDFVLGQLGHPRYKGPRHTQYKLGGIVRNPYETLF